MERDSPPHLPLGHKLIAVVIAAAVAGGVHFWLARNAVQSTSTAELSFDPAAAQRIDPGVVGSTEPAVAVAQSMLSDEAVAGLSQQAFLSSSSMAARVGEFRARLELTEPSTNVLRVHFRDADPGKAAGTANAVAKALAAGIPGSAAATPSQVTSPQPAPQPSKPSPRITAAPQGRADHSLSDSLAELATLLSSTNRKLENLGAPAGKSKNHHRQHGGEPASYSLAKQQQLLKAQVRTAQKKLDDARAAAGHDSIPGAKDRLAEIQEELSSILPGRAAGSHSFNSAGVDSGQMRRERAQLVRTIAAVDKARVVIRRQEDARSAPTSEAAAESAAPSSAASNAATPAPAPQPAPLDASAAAGQPSQSPLRLVRAAGTAAHPLWWPQVLAGLLAGLLYLGVAALRYRHFESESEDGDGTAETSHYGNRLITPDAPVSAPDLSQHRVFKDLLETPPQDRPRPADTPSPTAARETPHNESSHDEAPPSATAASVSSVDAAPETVPSMSSSHDEAPPSATAASVSSVDAAPEAVPFETVPSMSDPVERAVSPDPPGAATEDPPAHPAERIITGQAMIEPGTGDAALAVEPGRVISAPETAAWVEPEPGVGRHTTASTIEPEPVIADQESNAPMAPRQTAALVEPEPGVGRNNTAPTIEPEPVVADQESNAPMAPRQTAGFLEAFRTRSVIADHDAAHTSNGAASEPRPENIVGMPDPWTDQIRRALSQTTIGRMFEGTLNHNDESAQEQRKDNGHEPSTRDRLAG